MFDKQSLFDSWWRIGRVMTVILGVAEVDDPWNSRYQHVTTVTSVNICHKSQPTFLTSKVYWRIDRATKVILGRFVRLKCSVSGNLLNEHLAFICDYCCFVSPSFI